MPKLAIILAGTAALALAGCNGSKQQAADNATENLEAQADNTATNLTELSANVADANQANALVDESAQLSNASQAAGNAQGNAH